MPLCYVILSKAVPSPLSSCFMWRPIQAHNVAYTIFWRDNQKIAGPWEGNTVEYPIPLDIQAFIFYVSYNMCSISISK